MRRAFALTTAGLAVLGASLAWSPSTATATTDSASAHPRFKHLVVIYEENHSFDNLFGGWGSVNGRRVDGINGPGYQGHATQVDQSGTQIGCMFQNDANLSTTNQKNYWIGEPTKDPATGTTIPPTHPGHQTPQCTTTLPNGGSSVDSHFTSSAPFNINDYISPDDTSCAPKTAFMPNGVLAKTRDAVNGDPQGEPGGCTRDLVHRFYQEQYQIDGGKQDRYPTGSDAAGLTQGHYDTKSLPVYKYLHQSGAPKYVIADHFFQSAFGGSFLNHQYLVAARAPIWKNPPTSGGTDMHSVLDSAGFPNKGYPLYAPQSGASYNDGALTQACPADPGHDNAGYPVDGNGRACGDYAVNTVQPANVPSGALNADGSVKDPSKPPMPLINDTDPNGSNFETNIGDELSAKNVPWAWYAGGWDDANAGHPDPLFQYHHQPFNYFANYAKGKPGREHLKDEKNFMDSAKNGSLPAVSFVKPIGEENEHPGYASTDNGESHLVDLLKTIESGPQADSTLVVVTYDEFGGQWDHVSPPGQGNNNGPHDSYGPGTRIPALVLGKPVQRSGVDSTSYDTTSILRLIEQRFGLSSMAYRDDHVNSLGDAVTAKP